MDVNSFARRTRGDGQERNSDVKESKSDLDASTSSHLETASCNSDSKIAKYLPKGKIYNLVPKLVGNTPSSGSSLTKSREPRFVPFEPYKAAVTPLVHGPGKRSKRGYNSKVAHMRGQVDVNLLASQLTANSDTLTVQGLSLNDTLPKTITTASDYQLMYEDMRKEKEYTEKQLKFQTQVNSELKNLLIAAVGEDLHDRVNVLTEDKLTLARALLDSSNDLTSHSEQIEYLAGQCEVWRSKFLASSLMLEELARWKTTLLEKNKHLVVANKELLKMIGQMRDMQVELLKNLSFLVRDKSQVMRMPSANVMDLARESLNISQQLALINTAMGVPSDLQLDGLERLTEAEKLAKDALQITEMNLIRTDDPFRAIVTHAFPTMVALRDEREKTERRRKEMGGEDQGVVIEAKQ